MANPRTPKDNQEKNFQDKMRKRLTGLFSGGEEPPTYMSISQVDALKAHVADLEAQLGQRQPAVPEIGAMFKQDSIPLDIEPVGLNSSITKNEVSQANWLTRAFPQLSHQESADLHETSVKSTPDPVEKKPKRNLFNFWQRFVEPPAMITQVGDKRQARLVSAILIVNILALGLGTIANIFITPNLAISRILASSVIGLCIAYFLSRSKYYRFATPLQLVVLVAIPIFSVTFGHLYSSEQLLDNFIFNVLMVLLCGTLLSTRTTAYFAAGSFLGLLLLPILIPSIPFGHIALPLIFNGVVSIFIVVFSQYRNLREKDRMAEISQANHALQASYASLNARTRELQFAAEVGRTVTEKVADIHEMLVTAVEMIRARFDLYYTQVYLMDSSGKSLILRAGTGNVGQELLKREYQLAVGAGSLNGRAVNEKRAMIVTDTMNNSSFLPNPLLPNTRSEMAIPLIAGDKVVGVLDMQSEQPGALSETNLTAFEALAGQLAIALQNATLFAQSEETRSRVEELVRRTAEEGWQDYLNATERGHKLGFAFDQTQVTALKEETLKDLPAANSLSVPIEVTGAKVGTIQVANEMGRTWTPRETGILHAASEQLAQHIENLRLLTQAEKYRTEAEQAVRRLTREGWDTYIQPGSQETTGFKYDLNEVSLLNEGENDNQTPVKHQPLKVRDEVIGELSVHDDNNSQEDTNELMSAVATQLSAHIENLRLSLSNMSLLKSTEERAQREQTLRQITIALRGSTNPATIMRTAVRELGSLLGRKTIVELSNLERPNQTESAINSENGSDSSANQS